MAHEADNLAPMFDKVAHDWYSDFWRTVSPKTLSQYDPAFDRIVVQFGNKRIDEIEPANIQAFLNDLKIKGYSASYVKTYRTVMSSQVSWNDRIKGIVWAEIVADKIFKQMELLYELGQNDEAELLSSYLNQIEEADKSNREGHAAKVYFNAIFGKKFTRKSENVVNAALNYGYSIILSSFNREISSAGYLTQIGIFHDNMFNHFNLSCDLMEPFRILVDRSVLENGYEEFGAKEKHTSWDILNQNVVINDSKQTVLNGELSIEETKQLIDKIIDQDELSERKLTEKKEVITKQLADINMNIGKIEAKINAEKSIDDNKNQLSGEEERHLKLKELLENARKKEPQIEQLSDEKSKIDAELQSYDGVESDEKIVNDLRRSLSSEKEKNEQISKEL